MKLIVFVALCLVATTLATPHSVNLRSRRQAVATTVRPDCTNAPNSGLSGLLEQVGNLVGNLLESLGRIRLQALVTGDGSVLTLLSDLLNQVQVLLNDLLLGGNDNDPNQQGLLGTLLNDITALLNNLFDGDEGNTWRCTRPQGPIGQLLGGVVGSLGNITGGGTNNNGGLLTGLLNVVLKLVSQLLALLL